MSSSSNSAKRRLARKKREQSKVEERIRNTERFESIFLHKNERKY